RDVVARIPHGHLLRLPILSSGDVFLVRPPRRTAGSTPASSSLARSVGGLRSRPARYGIHGESALARLHGPGGFFPLPCDRPSPGRRPSPSGSRARRVAGGRARRPVAREGSADA